MSGEDGAEENPYTRIKVIDGTVKFDVVNESYEDDGTQSLTESYLVGVNGTVKVSSDIMGSQNVRIYKSPLGHLLYLWNL